MEHCKDKLPTPAGLWFFVLLYPTFITYINSLYSLFWPTQQGILYVFWVNEIFFFFTKTQNRYIAWCWISALTQDKHKFYILLYISTDETGWVPGENSSLARKVYQRERNDSFFVLPAVITSACSWGKHLTSSIQCSWMLKNSAWFLSFRNVHLRKYDFLRVSFWLKKRLLITLSAMYDPL